MLIKTNKGKIDPIDQIIGERLFSRRRLLGLSQQDLAKAIGVSIQQIQKYEKAVNRIPSSRLYYFVKVLKLSSTDYFFSQMLAENNVSSSDSEMLEDMLSYEEKEKESDLLLKEYSKIKSRNIRRLFLELIECIAKKG